MTIDVQAGAASGASRASRLRFILPLALLGLQFLALSVLVDLPMTGPAMQVVDGVRIAIPVVLGAVAAGWLVARTRSAPAMLAQRVELPRWKPFPALVGQLGAFAVTTLVALKLLGPSAPPPGPWELVGLVACGGVSALLAVAVAAPLRWAAAEALRRWRLPMLALLLGAVTWQVAFAVEQLWGALSFVTLRAAAAIVGLVAPEPVVLDLSQALIGVGDFEVTVAPVCSGVEGMGLVVTFQLIWIALARERLRLRRAVWLLPVGAAVAMAGNILRIAGLVLLGGSGHADIAVGGFHSKVGWALFLGIAFASIAAAERLPALRRGVEPEAAPAPAVDRPDTLLVAPLVFALAAALLTGVWTSGALDRAYALRIVAGAVALVAVRRLVPCLRPTANAVPALLGAVVGVAWAALLHGDPQPLAEELAALGGFERNAWLLLRAVGSVALIPLFEELAFREFLYRWLTGPQPPPGAQNRIPWGAVIVSSLAFGALHGSFVAGALAGVVFGVVRAWRGRLGDAVVAHAVANLVVCGAALALGRWDLWT